MMREPTDAVKEMEIGDMNDEQHYFISVIRDL
jgi:hypothetical protein